MSCDSLHVVIHIDGGSRGNPGPAGAGVAIRDKSDNSILYKGGVFLGNATNNVAEYSGLLTGLSAAKELKAASVELFSDSQLLVRQMTGEYRVKNAGLKPLHRRATELADSFENCTFHHIPREENTAADKLANMAMDAKTNILDAADDPYAQD
ncbi:MAG: ribonuclease HI family protein [Phycisphaerae bacterium]|jgi:ribonuclease HI|nr:ribonuclease HI family protein [Phycisphaerae bacterium]